MNDNEPQICIVLRAVDYKEADKILTLFSREKGKMTAQARGVRRISSRLRACAQLFCCAEYEFYIRNNKYYIKNSSIKLSFLNILNDYQRYAAGCAMLKITNRILENSDIWNKLFSRLVNTLYALDRGEINPEAALAYYLVHVIELTGIFPLLDECAACGKKADSALNWSAAQGGIICNNCATNVAHTKVDKNIPRYFKVLRHIIAKDVMRVLPESDTLNLLKLIEEYLNYNLEVHFDIFKFIPRQL